VTVATSGERRGIKPGGADATAVSPWLPLTRGGATPEDGGGPGWGPTSMAAAAATAVAAPRHCPPNGHRGCRHGYDRRVHAPARLLQPRASSRLPAFLPLTAVQKLCRSNVTAGEDGSAAGGEPMGAIL